MGKKYRFIKSMPFVEAFGSLDPELYLFSMHTLVATQHLHSMVRVRSVLCSLGRPTYNDIREVFVCLVRHSFQPLGIDSKKSQKLERLTAMMFNRTSNSTSINKTRR